MEDQLKQILESLPEKPPRSRLAPYREFIEELRQLGRTYRDIAAILAEKCQLRVSASAIRDFVRIHSRDKTKRPNSTPQLRERSVNSAASNDIAAGENQGMDATPQEDRASQASGHDDRTNNRAISGSTPLSRSGSKGSRRTSPGDREAALRSEPPQSHKRVSPRHNQLNSKLSARCKKGQK